MLRRLTLLRHAKSSWDRKDQPDRDRPLNERGEQDAPLMARRLRQLGVRPSLIVTSTATRAVQTTRLLARELGYPLEFLQRESALYLATPSEILSVLAGQDDSFGDVLVCAHNPGIEQLAAALSGDRIDRMPTCAAAVFESKLDSWRGVERAEWSMRAFDYPKNEQPPAAPG